MHVRDPFRLACREAGPLCSPSRPFDLDLDGRAGKPKSGFKDGKTKSPVF